MSDEEPVASEKKHAKGIEGFDSSIAILVGINAYADPIPALTSAVPDVWAVARTLRRSHGFRTYVLADKMASRDRLMALLSDMQNWIDTGDRVIFYFAGHGVVIGNNDKAGGPQGFIFPHDADKNDPRTLISMAEVEDLLSALRCRHMFVVLDCCFAGAYRWSGTRSLVPAANQLDKQRLEWFIKYPAWQALASAGHDQTAAEAAAGQNLGRRDGKAVHSPFAEAFVDGLKGAADTAPGDGKADGIITATELFQYVERRVFMAVGPRQRPQLWHLEKQKYGEFVFRTPGKPIDTPEPPELNEAANPWKGLKAYDVGDDKLFFGRRVLSENLLARTLTRPVTVVTGASGSGKSSLVRAGLCWRAQANGLSCAIMRPGDNPYAALAAVLGAPVAQKGKWQPFTDWIAMYSGPPLVLIVDQAEDLITRQGAREDYEDFLKMLAASQLAAHRAADPLQFADANKAEAAIKARDSTLIVENVEIKNGVWRARVRKNGDPGEVELSVPRYPLRIVLTVRTEYAAQLQSLAPDTWQRSLFQVPALAQDELRRVIEGPAGAKAMLFESEDLIDTLINDVVGMPGSLPLLSLALSEMYREYLSDPAKLSDRTLRKVYYTKHNGISGIIHSVADGLVSKHRDSDGKDVTVRRVMERFVSNETGAWTRRQVPKSELKFETDDENERAEKLLEDFQNAFLIVSDEASGKPYYELAHDSLLLGWKQLRQWYNEDANLITELRKLGGDANQWSNALTAASGAAGQSWGFATRVRRMVQSGWRAFDPVKMWCDAGITLTCRAAFQAMRTAWRDNGSSELWSYGAGLESVIDLRNSKTPGLNNLESQFAEASLLRARRNSQARLAVAMVLVTAVCAWQYSSYMRALDDKRARISEVAQFWMAPPQSNPGTAAAFLAEQLRNNAKLDSDLLHWSLLQAMHSIQENVTIDHSGAKKLLVEPQGLRFAIWSPTSLSLWHAGNGQLLWEEKGANFAAADVDWNTGLVSVGDDNGVQLFSLTGAALLPIRLVFAPVTKRVVFNAAGTAVLALGTQGKLCVWRLPVGSLESCPMTLTAGKGAITDAGWMGSRILAVTDCGSLAVWDIAEAGEAIKRHEVDPPTQCGQRFKWEIEVSELGNQAATWIDYWFGDEKDKPGAKSMQAVLWRSAERGYAPYEFDALQVSGMTYSADGSKLAVRSHKKAYLFDTREQKNATASPTRFAQLNGHNSYIHDIRFSSDSAHVITASSDRSIGLWNSYSGARIETLNAHRSIIRQAATTDDGCYAISLGADEKAIVWSRWGAWNSRLSEKPCDGKPPQNHYVVNSVAFSADGELLATASADHIARVWNIRTGDLLHSFRFAEGAKYDDGALAVAFSPDTKWLAVGGGSKENAPQHTKLDIFSLKGTANPKSEEVSGRVRTLAFSPKPSPPGRQTYELLASVGDGTARILEFDGTAIKNMRSLKHGAAPVTSAAWSANGERIATASTDKNVCVFKASSRKTRYPCSKTNAIVYDVSWSHIRNDLAVANGDAQIRMLRDGRSEERPRTKLLDDRYPEEIEFSPDDKLILARLSDGTIMLRDLDMMREVYQLQPGSSTATAVAMSPGGRYLAIGYKDGTARVLRMSTTSEILAETTARPLRCLRPEERQRYRASSSDETAKELPPCSADTTPVMQHASR